MYADTAEVARGHESSGHSGWEAPRYPSTTAAPAAPQWLVPAPAPDPFAEGLLDRIRSVREEVAEARERSLWLEDRGRQLEAAMYRRRGHQAQIRLGELELVQRMLVEAASSRN
jgi:hypothetical protein